MVSPFSLMCPACPSSQARFREGGGGLGLAPHRWMVDKAVTRLGSVKVGQELILEQMDPQGLPLNDI